MQEEDEVDFGIDDPENIHLPSTDAATTATAAPASTANAETATTAATAETVEIADDSTTAAHQVTSDQPTEAATPDDPSTTVQQIPAVEKCKMCRKRIYPHNDRFRCTECRRSYHKQEDCSGLTIKMGKILDRSKWR